MKQNHFFIVLTLFVALFAISYKEYFNYSATVSSSLIVTDQIGQIISTGTTTTVTVFSNEEIELEVVETVESKETEPMVETETQTQTVAAEEIEVLPVLPIYTKASLAKYDGEDLSLPIYIALEGSVYDVSSGREFYAPGGTYHFLAGTDGTLLLKTFGGDLIKQKYPVVGTYQDQ